MSRTQFTSCGRLLRMRRSIPRLARWGAWAVGSVASLAALTGCPELFPPPDDSEPPSFANTTDKTNGAARYVGASSCTQCHQDIAAWHRVHGHAHKLTRIEGGPPQFPAEGLRAGIPSPPDGFDWSDISYVIGGYTKKGRFIDQDGYVLTDGVEGVHTQWNLDFPPNGTTAGFVAYEASATAPKPYAFSCFECHTTGAMRQDEDFPQFEENRPGFIGTWEEPGIQCEACHGPGGGHFSTAGSQVNIDRSRIFVDPTGASSCNQCHNRPFDSQTGVIPAAGGFIQHHEQYNELQASGGHASLTCTTCHDPHRSVTYDRTNAIRNECIACHSDMNMARHAGKAYTSASGYTEVLSCESCHMTYATKSGSSALMDSFDAADGSLLGQGRIGDTRTHIFRINTNPVDYTAMFSEDGSQVARDAEGMAAVTVDFVCLRCHNGQGSVFGLSVERAAEIAGEIHSELP